MTVHPQYNPNETSLKTKTSGYIKHGLAHDIPKGTPTAIAGKRNVLANVHGPPSIGT